MSQKGIVQLVIHLLPHPARQLRRIQTDANWADHGLDYSSKSDNGSATGSMEILLQIS